MVTCSSSFASDCLSPVLVASVSSSVIPREVGGLTPPEDVSLCSWQQDRGEMD